MNRVALIVSSFLPRFGGVERHVLEVSRGLRDRGYEVTIWAVDQGDEVPSSVDGIPLRYLPCPLPARDLGSLVKFLRRLPAAIRAWRRAVRTDRPQILNVQCFGPNGVYATVLSRFSGIPLVYSAHGETSGDADDIFTSSRLIRRALAAGIRRSSAITACSRFAADDLLRFAARTPPVHIVFNGVDRAPPRPATMPPLPPRFIAAVGRLVPNKGFGELIAAFAPVAAENGDVGLVIAGDGPDRQRLEELTDRHGLTQQVRLLGRLSAGQVHQLLQHAEMLVVPSHVEAFGIAILEGWRAGAPVIATSRGGAAEFVQDTVNGLLVDPFDAAALSTAMLSLLGDPVGAAHLARAGSAAFGPFTWDAVSNRYQAVLDRVGADGPSRPRSPSRLPRRHSGD
ncbi:glycosyltransferase family 4 protein [Pseudactinotalea sp. Z1732]|uniref:glycosyltransferase family 4 protein n=1 Tax=Pseudactinotalea sp. Z1732 TaxID=3413026 RepID=UPI003C7D36A6